MTIGERHSYPYALIGNCQYTAHISTEANIAFMCWPRFDSNWIFGEMIDSDSGGRFSIRPDSSYQSAQSYLANTNIVRTEFTSEDGKFEVIDIAPRYKVHGRVVRPHFLLRKIVPLEGTPRVKVECRPRLGSDPRDSELAPPRKRSNHITYERDEIRVRLYSTISPDILMDSKSFTLRETEYLILTWDQKIEEDITDLSKDLFSKTKRYWENWVKKTHLPTKYQEEVIRSALTLKLHQYEDTGAIIAAATTSLPESPGGPRNWDYRYCWIRDSYYTLKALNHLGHFSGLTHFSRYLQDIGLEHSEEIQPLYGLNGEDRLEEYILNLNGYLNNSPVRVGNQAYLQKQYDVYGQVLLALLPLFRDKRLRSDQEKASLKLVHNCLLNIKKTLHTPDAGIWEFRGMTKLHVHTLLFDWAGAQVGKTLAIKLKDRTMLDLSNELIEESSKLIESAYNPKLGCYTTAVEDLGLDAANFLLITMGYLDPQSSKAKDHVLNLGKALASENGLIYRYNHADDFGMPEVAFTICGFWYAEALAMVGELEKAQWVFEQHLKASNHVGLLSEDIDPKDLSQWGNFPQTYSHVGLISTAFRLEQASWKPPFLER